MSASTNEELQMTFWEHLEELRGRILKALVAFGVGAGTAWYFRGDVLLWLITPFVTAWAQSVHGEAPALHAPAPASSFVAYLRLSIMAGFIFSLPVIFYQIWAF